MRSKPVCFILLLLLLTAPEVLHAQEWNSRAQAYYIPRELFYIHIGDIRFQIRPPSPESLNRVLYEAAWTAADEVSGKELDRVPVFWKYYVIPGSDILPVSETPLVVVESYETRVSVYFRGVELQSSGRPEKNRMGYEYYHIPPCREGERIYFRVQSNPYAGEEIYLAYNDGNFSTKAKFPFLYLYRDLLSIIFAIFAAIVGLGMLVFYLVRIGRGEGFLLWFSLFSFAYAAFSLFSANIDNVLLSIPPRVDFFIPLLARDLMPILLLFFYLAFMGDTWLTVFQILGGGQIAVLGFRLFVMLTGLFSEWSDLASLIFPVLIYIVVSLHLILKQRRNQYTWFFYSACIVLGTAYALRFIGEILGLFGTLPFLIGPMLFFLILGLLPFYSYFRKEALIREQNISFARFVPMEFLASLEKKEIVQVRLGDQIERNLTILFTDIRSFTTISEGMTPERNFAFLNRFLGVMGPIIRDNGGFVDKYIGDAVMALFPRQPVDAVWTARDMLQGLEQLNNDAVSDGFPQVEIGIGIHTGPAMLGILGESHRYQGTVISDAVNLAFRLKGLTKKLGHPIIISEQTAEQLGESFPLQYLGTVRVKGKTAGTKVYTLRW